MQDPAVPAVPELTLDIPEGEIVIFVGPSGCGKTTTLEMVNRLIEPTSGRIHLEGDDVTHAEPDQARDLRCIGGAAVSSAVTAPTPTPAGSASVSRATTPATGRRAVDQSTAASTDRRAAATASLAGCQGTPERYKPVATAARTSAIEPAAGGRGGIVPVALGVPADPGPQALGVTRLGGRAWPRRGAGGWPSRPTAPERQQRSVLVEHQGVDGVHRVGDAQRAIGLPFCPNGHVPLPRSARLSQPTPAGVDATEGARGYAVRRARSFLRGLHPRATRASPPRARIQPGSRRRGGRRPRPHPGHGGPGPRSSAVHVGRRGRPPRAPTAGGGPPPPRRRARARRAPSGPRPARRRRRLGGTALGVRRAGRDDPARLDRPGGRRRRAGRGRLARPRGRRDPAGGNRLR
ncbi:MAG: ATP-binding cassette domain-containing protein [Euzebyaceae bacterium]|nr:ATP-binding cassette domain-containing protein [Euzebyaceae bacterium]